MRWKPEAGIFGDEPPAWRQMFAVEHRDLRLEAGAQVRAGVFWHGSALREVVAALRAAGAFAPPVGCGQVCDLPTNRLPPIF